MKLLNEYDKVFQSGLRKFCGRQPLKNLLSPLLNTFSYIEIIHVTGASINHLKVVEFKAVFYNNGNIYFTSDKLPTSYAFFKDFLFNFFLEKLWPASRKIS